MENRMMFPTQPLPRQTEEREVPCQPTFIYRGVSKLGAALLATVRGTALDLVHPHYTGDWMGSSSTQMGHLFVLTLDIRGCCVSMGE